MTIMVTGKRKETEAGVKTQRHKGGGKTDTAESPQTIKKELLNAICSKFEVLSAKDDGALADEIHALRQLITEQTSKPQHKKVIHDLTTKTWWLVEVSTVLFFLTSSMRHPN